MKNIIPVGVRDYLPDEVNKRQESDAKAAEVFENAGYRRVIAPLFEYWSTLEPICSKSLREKAITFFNPNGDLLVIRPDHTMAIARMAATRLKQETGPFQFYYSDAVYRMDPVNGETEHYQLGVENIGTPGIDEEAKLIQTCITTLNALGIKNLSIELNHTQTLENKSEDERQALKKRDYTQLDKFPTREALNTLSNSHPLHPLKEALNALGLGDKIFVNESIQTASNDYDGMFFECLIDGQGQACGAGGRYDSLLEHFGIQQSAIGFALDYTTIKEALG